MSLTSGRPTVAELDRLKLAFDKAERIPSGLKGDAHLRRIENLSNCREDYRNALFSLPSKRDLLAELEASEARERGLRAALDQAIEALDDYLDLSVYVDLVFVKEAPELARYLKAKAESAGVKE